MFLENVRDFVPLGLRHRVFGHFVKNAFRCPVIIGFCIFASDRKFSGERNQLHMEKVCASRTFTLVGRYFPAFSSCLFRIEGLILINMSINAC